MEISEHIVQVLLALGFVVALVVGLGLLVRRMNQGNFRAAAEIRIVASTFLGAKERIVLVQVRDRQILLGVNSQCINALGEFASPEPAPAFDSVLREAGT